MAKLGVCSWSLAPRDPQEIAARLKSLGIPRVQLALVPCMESAAWRGGIDFLRGEGIEILSGMLAFAGEDYTTLESIARTGGVRSDQHWARNLDRALSIADLAEQSGIPLVTFHGGFLPHGRDIAVRASMLDRLRTVADIFAARGVAIALETGQESAATLLAALEELDRPGVGVNFDPANMILYGMGDPVEAIEQLAPRLRQVHIKDACATEVPGRWGTEVPVGEGQVRWREFLALALGVDLVIERESGSGCNQDLVRARDLVRGLVPTIA
ncbi:MAG: sugar phosphate isomerase/epimerase [Phycisphaerales bacterium]|nr:sugar phosphate isomerase/epimerase [Phycisphaerales bacterium]